MNKPFFLSAALAFGLLACTSKSGKSQLDFNSLTEDQKRMPENALASMHVAEGLEVKLFAAEPMVTNPTNMSVDSKGRVWICEAYNYDVSPETEDKKGDRIIVLEDTDHDGKADKRTVFYQGTDITTPLGILAIGNKVYVTRSPNLFVFTDTDGDLVADKKDTLFMNMGKKGDHSAHSMFPGPDGKFYFSTGNFAGEIHDNKDNPIIDKGGVAVNQKGQPYLGGMVLRCDPDGKNFEVLGHNFRNNYEPCIDSYGNIFQSDNDDDGNESCRINFVMYYGNYGYLDELTKASWGANRVGIEKTVPERHWHQNDPGVVPNLLITGAGSPAGMTFYEGDLLPEQFRNSPVHTEPYYNVVRAYPVVKKNSGYTATTSDILKSDDQWFRPVDVTTAPDGSLFVADWYDPILGGGAAGDANRGRIYRIAPVAGRYEFDATDLASADGAIRALKSASIETRYEGFERLAGDLEKSRVALQTMWKLDNPVFRVRAFWLLASGNNNEGILREALADKNPDIRVAAVRAVLQFKQDVVPFLKEAAKDSDPSVRREVALALRYSSSPEAALLWTDLAAHYDGKDRLYLEALGIGADLHADLFFETWLASTQLDVKQRSHQDIIWRSRSAKAVPLLAKLIRETSDTESTFRYFRAFDFHSDKSRNNVLTSLVGLDRPDGQVISVLALRQMDGSQVKLTPSIRKALDAALVETRGTVAFVNLIEKFGLKDRKNDLLELAIEAKSTEPGSAAVDLIIKFNEINILERGFHRNDVSTLALLQSVKGKGNPDVVRLISDIVNDSSRTLDVRQAAVQSLGSSWPGETKLLDMVKSPEFAKALKPSAASVLFNVYRSSIQREAEKYLTRPATGGSTLPSIKELVASSGSTTNGKQIFTKYCTSCHRTKEEGVKFGPELTQIGSKLSKDGIFRAIMFPNDGISYGFESYLVTQQDGSQTMGIISSETDNEIELDQPGGTSVKISKNKIKAKEKGGASIMPDLTAAMSKQELIDLVSYLAALKK